MPLLLFLAILLPIFTKDVRKDFMITKTQLLAAIENLPEKVTVDQVIDQLIFIEKVERGLKDSENNEVHSHAEAKKMLAKWFY